MSTFPRQTGEWVLLMLSLPGRSTQAFGIILVDSLDGLHVRLRRDWSYVAPDDEYAAVLSEFEEDLAAKGRDLGGTAVLNYLEDSASHTLQVRERHPIDVADVRRPLEELFNRLVTRAKIRNDDGPQQKPYRVHAAVAAIVLMTAILAGIRAHVSALCRSMPPSVNYSAERARLLPDSPQQPAPLLSLESVPDALPATHRRSRSQIKITHVHRKFQIMVPLTFQPPVVKAVQIDAPPLYEVAELTSTSVFDISLPEPPPFPARRNPLVQFLFSVASPIRKLFSPRSSPESVLN